MKNNYTYLLRKRFYSKMNTSKNHNYLIDFLTKNILNLEIVFPLIVSLLFIYIPPLIYPSYVKGYLNSFSINTIQNIYLEKDIYFYTCTALCMVVCIFFLLFLYIIGKNRLNPKLNKKKLIFTLLFLILIFIIVFIFILFLCLYFFPNDFNNIHKILSNIKSVLSLTKIIFFLICSVAIMFFFIASTLYFLADSFPNIFMHTILFLFLILFLISISTSFTYLFSNIFTPNTNLYYYTQNNENFIIIGCSEHNNCIVINESEYLLGDKKSKNYVITNINDKVLSKYHK